jgi:RHS repeat-associated protein
MRSTVLGCPPQPHLPLLRAAGVQPQASTALGEVGERSETRGGSPDNPDKQLTNTLRPDGVELTRAYDAAGRLSLLTMPTGTVQYEYYDNTVCVGCAPGSLKRLTGPGSSIIDLTYDGSLLKSTQWSGPVNKTISWTHDPSFRTSTETVAPGGSTITYAYDNDDLVTCASRGLCTPPSNDALKLTYDPANGLLTQTVIGGLTETFTYNDKGELATHTASFSGNPVYSGTFHSTAAPRDNLGRITQKVETVNGVTRTDDYQYDTRGRLLNVARNGDLVSVYDYDDNGNRLSLTNPSTSSVTMGSYDDQDRVMAYGSYQYTFNQNGDLISKTNTATSEETTYEYDARGSLLSVVLPDDTLIEYVVDGQGRRIGKKVNGLLTQGLIYKDDLRISAELDGAGNIVAQFVYVEPSHSPDFMLKSGQVYRFVKDQLGSPRIVINVLTGVVAQALEYDEFGQILTDSAPGFQPFGFAGGLYDRNTGLVRFGSRDYDAGTGRWTAKDPTGLEDGPNVYVYVLGDAINLVDLTGRTATAIPWGPIGAGAAAGAAVGGAAGALVGAALACLFLTGDSSNDRDCAREAGNVLAHCLQHMQGVPAEDCHKAATRHLLQCLAEQGGGSN